MPERIATENCHRELPHRIATENCHTESPHRIVTQIPQRIATQNCHRELPHRMTKLPPLKVFLGGHDDFGPSGNQSAQESIIPHLLGESYNIPRMDLPSIGLCVEIDIPAFPGFCQIRPIRVPKISDFGKCSNRQSDTTVRQGLAWEAQIRP